MNAHDFIDSLAVSSLFLPYWKTAGKYLSFHLPALCLGVVAFVFSNKPHKGGAAMNPTEKQINGVDYLVAHPLAMPFWVWLFIYIFMDFAPLGFVGVAFPPALFCLLAAPLPLLRDPPI